MSETTPTDETPLDLERLREVAEAATPGPWSAADEHALLGPDAHPAWCISRMRPGFETMTPVEGYMFDVAEIVHDGERTEADAEHIATFDPPTVLALLDRLKRAEAAVETPVGPEPTDPPIGPETPTEQPEKPVAPEAPKQPERTVPSVPTSVNAGL